MKTSLVLLLCCLAAVTLACRRRSGGTTTKVSNPEKIAREAERRRGSTIWSYASSYKTGSYTWKCNIFVAEMIEGAGAKVPHRHWWTWSPIGAGEWANPYSSYLINSGCWTRVYVSTRGDVAAYQGHVGIVTAARRTTSAAEHSVVTNDWGFRSGQYPTFWHYKC